MATSARRRLARASRTWWAALAVALSPSLARAFDITLQLYPTFGYTRDRTTGAVTSSSESWSLLQKYRLGLGQELSNSLRFDAAGFLSWDKGWTLAESAWTDTDRKLWNGDLRLSFGGQPLGGAAYYTYQQSTSETSAGGLTLRLPEMVREAYGLSMGWGPEGLPRLTLFYDRSHQTDVPRQSQDTVSNTLLVSAQYSPVRTVALRYAFGFNDSENRLSGVTSETFTQQGQVSWSDSYWERRLVVAASYQAQATDIRAHGAAGTGSAQLPQAPQAGLSIVEPTTSLPDQIRLVNTPALVDGNLTAGAGVDIGWGASQTGDPRPRDIGAQFADPLTEVELVYVWVDRRLPPDVAAAFQWTAWRSDDGEHWTSVALSGQVQFGALDNRFEIPVAATHAPYVKVVVRPLPLGVTTDRQYVTILVTEIQLFRVSTVPAGGLRQFGFGGLGSASARLSLLPPWNLTWDVSGTFTHRNTKPGVDWSLINGLSASRRLTAILEGRARIEQLLGKIGLASGEVMQNDLRFTAGLDAGFLPTLRAAASYQGQVAFVGSSLSRNYNAVLMSATAEFYKGVTMSGDGSYTWGVDKVAHADFSNAVTNATISVTPNSVVTVTGGGGYGSTTSVTSSGTQVVRTGQITTSLVVTPLRSLFASASLTRYPWNVPPVTVYNLAANFSPLPGGQLLLNITYSENYDLTNNVRTTIWGPSLRWTIRPATFLTAAYSQLRGYYPTYQTLQDGVFVSLMINL